MQSALTTRGHTGLICDDYWDKNDGDVVCRMLGFRFVTIRSLELET